MVASALLSFSAYRYYYVGMANLFDYILWRGDLGFDQFPFNPVDNLVFSQLSYLPMDGMVPEPGKGRRVSFEAVAARTAERNAGRPASKDVTIAIATSVINAIRGSSRFGNCELISYVNRTDPGDEIQFSAFCALIGKKRSSRKLLVVYRGTDTSIVGWKEDLNMSFVNSIPAQKEAVSYLEEMAGRFPYPLLVAGHSKGGNLAIYAPAFCDESIQRRVTAIYSNDAPGFRREVIQSDGYKAIRGRIQAFVPQSSFVGMLFEHGVSPRVVKSSKTGIFQHDLCSWEVTRDNIAGGVELTSQGRFVNNIVHEWMEKIDDEQRREAIDALYKVLASTQARSLVELGSDWRNAVSIISGIKNINGTTKKMLGKLVGEFLKTTGKNIMRQRKKTDRKA